MELAEIIRTDQKLKAEFEDIMYLESLVDSIDYKDADNVTQQMIDDHTTVNMVFNN